MATLERITPHISRVRVRNATSTNIYVVEEAGGHTLVDPGPIGTASSILALDRAGLLRIRRVVVTHAHPAHAGSASRVARGTGVSTFVTDEDAPHLDGRVPPLLPRGRSGRPARALSRFVDLCPPIYRIERLQPGVPVGDLLPVSTPGHTPGHVALLHRGDSALLSGDALLWDGRALHLPDDERAGDPAAARAALEALLPLDFEVLLPGHGPPLVEGAQARLASLLAGPTGSAVAGW